MSSQKTPVSILTEMMVKKKIIPAFELIKNEDVNPTTRFTYQVTCDGLIATGSARNKKEAKHESAREMLEKVATRDAQLNEKSLKRPIIMESSSDNVIISKKSRVAPSANAIGALIQICTKKLMDLPQYKIDETGPAHMKTFSVTCTLSTLTAYGYGKTKKQAKNEAASKMWEMVNEQISTETVTSGSENIESLPFRLQNSGQKKGQNFLSNDSEIVQVNSTNEFILPAAKVFQDKNVTEQLIPDSSSVKMEKILQENDNVKNIKTISCSDETITDFPLSDDNNLNLASSSDEMINNVKDVTDGNLKVHNPLATKILETNDSVKNIKSVSSLSETITDVPLSEKNDNNTKEVDDEKVKVQNPLSTKLQNNKKSPLLQFMQMKATSNKLLISEGHFKKCFEDNIREQVLKQVIDLLKEINTANEITDKTILDVRQSFSELLKHLKLTYKCKKLETKSSKFIMFVEISTNPDINEIGIADTLHQAEIMGIKLILQLLIKML